MFGNGGILVGRCRITAAVVAVVPGNIKYPSVRLFINQRKMRGNGINHQKAPTENEMRGPDKKKKKEKRLSPCVIGIGS